MTLTSEQALFAMSKIIAVAVIFQCLEFFQIRKTFSETGVWRWSLVREEFKIFPKLIQRLLDFLLNDQVFLVLLFCRILAAGSVLFFPHPAVFIFLFLSSVLICLRWRGTFNGGSDFMTLIVLMALSIAALFKNSSVATVVQEGVLWYVALQVCHSYFVAGIVKIKRENWRQGKALAGFLNTTVYKPDSFSSFLTVNASLVKVVAWAILFFECSFPVVLLHPTLCIAYISLALFFHLANAYLFGLNRFLYAWVAAYPALYYCSLRLNFLLFSQ